jgi:peptide/nickel transport system ATP-binding protein
VFRIGSQIAEVIRVHEKMPRAKAKARAVELLGEVGIPNPRARAREYPHQFSGGMRQRAMIAMALALDPVLLLADEPTTALDVTVQAQIMELLENLRQQRGTAIVLITHDLGLVASHADRVMVMYAGRVAEYADTNDIFYRPRHAYTFGLLGSSARLDRRRPARLDPIPGSPPSLIRVPPGCPFHPRCGFATDVCKTDIPALAEQDTPSHLAACHHSDDQPGEVAGSAAAGGAAARGHQPEEVLPGPHRDRVPASDRRCEGGRRHLLQHREGGDPGAGRRVGLWEEHHRPQRVAAAGADLRHRAFRGPGHHPCEGSGATQAAP